MVLSLTSLSVANFTFVRNVNTCNEDKLPYNKALPHSVTLGLQCNLLSKYAYAVYLLSVI